MRLWHQDLIKKLPRQQLLGQHRECCALRGNGWGRNHATINYIFRYPAYYQFAYHILVMEEMQSRGYNVSLPWFDKNYRGQNCEPYINLPMHKLSNPIYLEHDNKYYNECLENLSAKGIYLFE